VTFENPNSADSSSSSSSSPSSPLPTDFTGCQARVVYNKVAYSSDNLFASPWTDLGDTSASSSSSSSSGVGTLSVVRLSPGLAYRFRVYARSNTRCDVCDVSRAWSSRVLR
jgi:hypothetical protein